MTIEDRARAIAANESARTTWSERLAGKLCADGYGPNDSLCVLEEALGGTVLPSLNVAVLRAIESSVRAEMRWLRGDYA